MRIPGIYVVIRGDASQLEVDLNRAKRMAKEASEAMSNSMANALTPTQIHNAYSGLIDSLSKLTRAGQAATQGLKPLGIELGDLQGLVGVTAEQWQTLQRRMLDVRGAREAERALQQLKRSLNLNDVEVLDYARAFGLSGASATAYGAALKTQTSGAMTSLAVLAESASLSKERIAALQVQAAKGVEMKVRTQALRGLVDQLGLSRSEIRALEKEVGVSLDRAERGVKGFAMAFSNISLYGGIYSAVALVQQLASAAVRAAMDMDKLRLTLEGVYGARAGAEGQYIAGYADTYGKGLVETSRAYIKFAAAAEYVGVPAKAVKEIFEATTKAITKVGGSTQDVAGSLVAISQMLSKGTVSAEEFRLQFAERIPGAMKMGADAMGVTVAEFKKLMETGQLVSTEFLPKLAVQLETFGQGWEKAAGSIEANIQRMKNQFALLAEALLSLDEAKAGVSGLARGMGRLREMAETYAVMEKLNAAARDGKISLDQFAASGGVTYTALRALADVPGFGLLARAVASLTADAGQARAALDDLAKRNAEQVRKLEEDYKSLRQELQTLQERARKGVDLGGTHAEMAQVVREMSEVQDALNRLTGTSYVVRLDFQANMGVVYEAQAAVQKLWEDSEQAKRASAEASLAAMERDYAKATARKAELPGLIDASSGDLLSRQGENALRAEQRATEDILAKTAYGIEQSREAIKKLAEESIKSGGAMATLRKAYDGVAVASLSAAQQTAHAQQEMEAAIADSRRALEEGLITQEQYTLRVDSARGTYDKFIESLNKTPRGGQSAMDSLARKLERTKDLIADLKAQIAGNDFDAALENIDRKYDMLLGDAQRGLRKVGGEAQALFDAIEEARGLEKQKLEMEALRERTAQVSQLMRELGELTGDRGMVREGMLAEITQQADAAKLALKGVFRDGPGLEDAFSLVDRKAELESLRARQQTADSWVEYYDLSVNKLKGIEDAHNREQVAIWENALSEYTANSDAMFAVRAQSYAQIAAAARASGDAELAVIAEVGKESLALARLQATQRYGASGDAFTATLAERWGAYKSEATRARDTMVAMGNAMADLGDDIASSFGSAMSDMVYAAASGTGSVQDIFDSFLDSLLQAVSNFAGKLVQTWMNDIIGQLGSSLLGALGGGLFSSGNVNTSALINAPIVAKAKGDVMGAPGPSGLSAYRNTIVSSPTFFPFATGIGLMGEAGPEAIMPLLGAAGAHRVRAVLPNGREDAVDLTRTASGHLGVQLPAWLANVQPFAGGWAPRVLSPSHTSLAPLAPLPGVQSGTQSGGSVKGGDGAAPQVNVTVNEAPGTKATVSQDSAGNINIQIEALERALAHNISRNVGPLARLMRK